MSLLYTRPLPPRACNSFPGVDGGFTGHQLNLVTKCMLIIVLVLAAAYGDGSLIGHQVHLFIKRMLIVLLGLARSYVDGSFTDPQLDLFTKFMPEDDKKTEVVHETKLKRNLLL